MNNIKLFAIVPAEDNHDPTQITIVLARDDHDPTCSVSCFGDYVASPPLQLVLAGTSQKQAGVCMYACGWLTKEFLYVK